MKGKPFTIIYDEVMEAYRIKGNTWYLWCQSEFEDVAMPSYRYSGSQRKDSKGNWGLRWCVGAGNILVRSLAEGEEMRVRARVVQRASVRINGTTIRAMRAIRDGRRVEIGRVCTYYLPPTDDRQLIGERFAALTSVGYPTWKLYTGRELKTGEGVWFVLTEVKS